MNGQQKADIVLGNQPTFTNVKVYASDDWYAAADATINDLCFETSKTESVNVPECSNPQYPGILQVEKNKLLTILHNWGTEWTINFGLVVKSYPQGWVSVLHFTTERDCCGVGDRIPFVKLENKEILFINAVNGDGNHITRVPYAENREYSISISQVLVDNQVSKINIIYISNVNLNMI